MSSEKDMKARGDNRVRNLIQEAEDWLFRMREHKDCCGTPIVRKLLEALRHKD